MNLASSVRFWTKSNLTNFHSLLKSCAEGQNFDRPLLLFRQLLESDVKPNDFTFSLLVKAWTSSSSSIISNSEKAKTEAHQVHTHLIKSGVYQFVYVSTALLDLYSRLGCLEVARQLFDDMHDKDVVSWNAMIYGFSRNGNDFYALQHFVQMLREGFAPNQTSLVSLIPSCGRRELIFRGKSVHAFGLKAGLDLDSQVKNALTSMYAKCADLEAAECLFEEVVDKTVVSWNTMIAAYGQSGFFNEAILVFNRMREQSLEVNPVTIISVLSANSNPGSTHCYAIKVGLVSNFPVSTSLVCEYARQGNSISAELLYSLLPEKNLVSVTALISNHAEKGDLASVMKHFAEMQQLEMKLDSVALVSILQGIRNPVYIGIGCAFHGYGLKTRLSNHILVANGLISMYSRLIDFEAAFSLFFEMCEKPLITWNSLISGCIQAGRSGDAFGLFCDMKMIGHCPDAFTIASLLSGCCQLGNLQFGEKLHNYVLRNNLEVEDFVGTALVDMYIKCGSIERAEGVFKRIKEPCLAMRNSMISGYSLYGLEQKAFACFFEILKLGLKPDKISFLGVLAACTHGGLVQEGRKYFKIMTEEFNILPDLQLCACMVGLLGRAGFFEEALLFIKSMELEPDFAVWGALLNACCIHQEVKLGECLAKKLFFLDNCGGGFYILMSNLYAIKGRWSDVARVREMMREIGGVGCSGISVIEVGYSAHMYENLWSKAHLTSNFLEP